MLMLRISLLLLVAVVSAQGMAAQIPGNRPLRIVAFGAHPDDAELKFAGTAALFAAQGHKVKLVALTNGDVGHFAQAGPPLAQRRKAEVEACRGKESASRSAVLDIHDGELMPDLETRKKVADLIREWQADIVLSHRPSMPMQITARSANSPKTRRSSSWRRSSVRFHAGDAAQSNLSVLFESIPQAVSVRPNHRHRHRRGRREEVGLYRVDALSIR